MRKYSTPAEVRIPAGANLSDSPFRHAATTPQRVVARRKTAAGWQDITAAAFLRDVVGLAKGLIGAGITPGERVALMAATSYEWTLIDYAIWTAGAVTVPIYETAAPQQAEFILRDSGAAAAFVEAPGQRDAALRVVRDAGPGQGHVWLVDADSLGQFAACGGEVTDSDVAAARARAAADLATIIYTSGTTGRPKGCRITHANLLAVARNAIKSLPELFDRGDASTLLALPLAHSFARFTQVAAVEAGIVLGHAPDTRAILADLASFRPTFLPAVPRVFEKVYAGAEQRAAAAGRGRAFARAADIAVAYSIASLAGRIPLRLKLRHVVFDRLVHRKLRTALGGKARYAVSGSAPLGERLGHFFRGAGITVLEGYGLTETTAPIAANTPQQLKVGTVGRPMPGCSVRIAPGGEVFVKGPNVFPGYWADDAATAAVFDEGWLRTGDLGELDADGFLRITGRVKDLIITAGGKNVAPGPLEDRLRAHPLISQCIVVGDGRPFVSSLITLDAEALERWKAHRRLPATAGIAQLVTGTELHAEIEAAVAAANAPVSVAESIRKFRILDTDFTVDNGYLTRSLKVRRDAVIRDFADKIDALYQGAQPGARHAGPAGPVATRRSGEAKR